MPRRRAKKVTASREQRQVDVVHGDFSVYDCFPPCKSSNIRRDKSNGSTAVGVRVSKAISRSWQTEARQITGCSAETALPPDITAIDDDIVLEKSGDHDNGSTSSPVLPGNKEIIVHHGVEHVYPLDLWYCIGKHIAPEDVSRFAQICHGAHVVVHSAQFWRNVYNRYCRHAANLPSSLQPDSVLYRVHGLRTRVVRALFHVYPPLSSRFSPLTSATAAQPLDLDRLVGLRCVRAWHEQSTHRRPTSAAAAAGAQQQQQQQWRFCFKFERASHRSRLAPCPLLPQRDPFCDHEQSHGNLLAHDDVWHNPDERSMLLVAVTSHYTPLPVVMGLVLIKAAASTDGLFAHRLRMVFYNEYIQPGRGSVIPSGAVAVDVDTLHSVNVLHWWHSSYPGNS